jgi:hypothetical protein
MSSLPTWAVWSIVVPLVLLSPVIAFLLAIMAEILVFALVDAGAPALVLLGAGVSGLVLFRRIWPASQRAASTESSTGRWALLIA